ncbi:hypothetical protein LAUMK191_04901 [Mycobacterium attenuatum]|uniref:Uncharacterized protein n=1 Tax=Mycobacterium attenuatum TaxID=2341086 RepID=A0A498QC25_9MYCO|nr:hypothetical protein LAUMK136_04916 [Mycobacterium attenuatum]VBA59193.1 hypothetical protein LAUMK191_04901 [Mycobacterium attenuatum]VBA61687.1 hypothetical protein LAUMK41_05069 [Mycobacterium attenuatum]
MAWYSRPYAPNSSAIRADTSSVAAANTSVVEVAAAALAAPTAEPRLVKSWVAAATMSGETSTYDMTENSNRCPGMCRQTPPHAGVARREPSYDSSNLSALYWILVWFFLHSPVIQFVRSA